MQLNLIKQIRRGWILSPHFSEALTPLYKYKSFMAPQSNVQNFGLSQEKHFIEYTFSQGFRLDPPGTFQSST